MHNISYSQYYLTKLVEKKLQKLQNLKKIIFAVVLQYYKYSSLWLLYKRERERERARERVGDKIETL